MKLEAPIYNNKIYSFKIAGIRHLLVFTGMNDKGRLTYNNVTYGNEGTMTSARFTYLKKASTTKILDVERKNAEADEKILKMLKGFCPDFSSEIKSRIGRTPKDLASDLEKMPSGALAAGKREKALNDLKTVLDYLGEKV